MKEHQVDYDALTERIDRRCRQLSVVTVDGIRDDRLAAIRIDSTGISTLEITFLSRGLHIAIPELLGVVR